MGRLSLRRKTKRTPQETSTPRSGRTSTPSFSSPAETTPGPLQDLENTYPTHMSGNITEPAYESEHAHLRQPIFLTPQLHSLNPQRRAMSRSPLKDVGGQDVEPIIAAGTAAEPKISGVEVNSGSPSLMHSKNSKGMDNASDIEAHMANEQSTQDDSTHWGLLSSIMNAAHHAASNIGGSIAPSRDNIKPHPKEEIQNDNENFGDHLDILLSNAHSKHLDDESTSLASRSNAHDVQFQPLRKTVLGTMGKGELRLEDLGVAHPKASMVEITQSRSQSSSDVEVPDGLDAKLSFDRTAKTSDNRSNRSLSLPRHNSQRSMARSMSPPPFRRSLSPGMMKSMNAIQPLQASHIRRSSSGHDNLSLTLSNGAASTSEPPSVMPSVELRNITFASPKRNREFHSTFKKLTRTERLIEDYSCALQRDILVHGRLYLSERHICFKSNILGWITNIIIPIHEIVRLEKKSTAALFPNAILIQTLHQKYVFASFLARDSTFDLITNIWNQLVRGSLGFNEGDVLMGLETESHNELSDEDSDEDDSAMESDDIDVNEDDDEWNHDDNEKSDGEPTAKHAQTEIEHEEVGGEVKLLEETIQAPLPKIYQLLYGKDTSFMKQVVTKQKNKEISPIPEFTDKSGIPTREYHYIKPLNGPVGPKETLCQVVETVSHKDFDSYALVTQTTKTPDVPSGGSFSIVTMTYLSWGANNSTKLTVYTYVNWTGKSWIKVAIDKGSIDGQKESIGILFEELKSKCVSQAPAAPSDDGGNVSNLPIIGPKTHSASTFKPEISSSETLLLEETLKAPLGTVYSVIFDPNYLRGIINAQKNFDLSDIPKFPERAPRERQYNYIKPLSGPIGPKQTKCRITETVEDMDLNSHIHVLQSVSTPDIPSGNSFSVRTNFYLTWSENNGTKLTVSTYVNWTGKSWIKGTIEKASIDGQKESVGILIKEVKSTLSSAGSKKRKRSKSATAKKDTYEDVDELLKNLAPKHGYMISIAGFDMLPGGAVGLIGGLVLSAIMVFFLLRITIRGGNQPALEVNGSSKVMIGGQEYILMPTVDRSLRDPRRKTSAEFEIWDWINERGGKDPHALDTSRDLIEGHELQDFREVVLLAQMNLDQLKQDLAKRGG